MTRAITKPKSQPIWEILRDIRIEQGLTLRALVERMSRGKEVSSSNIGDWEKGITEPRITSIERWAEALGYEIELMKKD